MLFLYNLVSVRAGGQTMDDRLTVDYGESRRKPRLFQGGEDVKRVLPAVRVGSTLASVPSMLSRNVYDGSRHHFRRREGTTISTTAYAHAANSTNISPMPATATRAGTGSERCSLKNRTQRTRVSAP